MSALGDLIAQVGDPALRARLEEEARRVLEGRKFGLVFEEHLPDDTLLPGVPVRRGGLAARRGDAGGGLLRVLRVAGGKALCVNAAAVPGSTATEIPLGELVAAARPGEPVYPCLEEMDRIGRGGPDAPWHALIEADNAHALQFLRYVCGGMVDCIYVDPPYNTGARDWKYNNDYVDQNDSWRHSKWLSMMKRRLRLAKKLLNPKDSVLIVTIDEKEYLHLGCLLEEMFPEARIQMVSTMINPAVVAREGGFGRCGEYIFLVMFGNCSPSRTRLPRDWVSHRGRTHTGRIRWDLLKRSGTGASRQDSPGGFYPVYINPQSNTIEHIGEPLDEGVSVPPAIEGLYPLLPIRSNGSEGRWQWTNTTFRERMAQGRVKVGGNAESGYTLYILKDGEYAKVLNGEFVDLGRGINNELITDEIETQYVMAVPGELWKIPSHDATQYGSRLLGNLFCDSRFPFPKSLYAVHDAIRFFVANKPDALIVDFFAGSGTTLHAVNLLNAEDGGRRRCIMVTNNEVSDAEATALSARGLQPGDKEWEALGIARHVTWPRTRCSIEGRNVRGEALEGNYGVETDDFEEDGDCVAMSRATGRPVRGKRYRKGKRQLYPKLAEMAMADGFKANAAFYRLSFLDKDSVALGRALEALLPTLWMKSGARGAPPGGVSLASSLLEGAAGSRTSGRDGAGLPEVRHLAAPSREESAREGRRVGGVSTAGGTPALPVLVFPDNRFAVLTDERAMPRLKEVLGDGEGWTAYLATDDGVAFRSMASELGRGVRCVQLYRDYLDNFRINRERE